MRARRNGEHRPTERAEAQCSRRNKAERGTESAEDKGRRGLGGGLHAAAIHGHSSNELSRQATETFEWVQETWRSNNAEEDGLFGRVCSHAYSVWEMDTRRFAAVA